MSEKINDSEILSIVSNTMALCAIFSISETGTQRKVPLVCLALVEQWDGGLDEATRAIVGVVTDNGKLAFAEKLPGFIKYELWNNNND